MVDLSDGMATGAAHFSLPEAARVVVDHDVLGGQPVVAGTRVPALTILNYLRQGHSVAEIQRDYPALPADGVSAVEAWAADKFGQGWRIVAPASA